MSAPDENKLAVDPRVSSSKEARTDARDSLPSKEPKEGRAASQNLDGTRSMYNTRVSAIFEVLNRRSSVHRGTRASSAASREGGEDDDNMNMVMQSRRTKSHNTHLTLQSGGGQDGGGVGNTNITASKQTGGIQGMASVSVGGGQGGSDLGKSRKKVIDETAPQNIGDVFFILNRDRENKQAKPGGEQGDEKEKGGQYGTPVKSPARRSSVDFNRHMKEKKMSIVQAFNDFFDLKSSGVSPKNDRNHDPEAQKKRQPRRAWYRITDDSFNQVGDDSFLFRDFKEKMLDPMEKWKLKGGVPYFHDHDRERATLHLKNLRRHFKYAYRGEDMLELLLMYSPKIVAFKAQLRKDRLKQVLQANKNLDLPNGMLWFMGNSQSFTTDELPENERMLRQLFGVTSGAVDEPGRAQSAPPPRTETSLLTESYLFEDSLEEQVNLVLYGDIHAQGVHGFPFLKKLVPDQNRKILKDLRTNLERSIQMWGLLRDKEILQMLKQLDITNQFNLFKRGTQTATRRSAAPAGIGNTAVMPGVGLGVNRGSPQGIVQKPDSKGNGGNKARHRAGREAAIEDEIAKMTSEKKGGTKKTVIDFFAGANRGIGRIDKSPQPSPATTATRTVTMVKEATGKGTNLTVCLPKTKSAMKSTFLGDKSNAFADKSTATASSGTDAALGASDRGAAGSESRTFRSSIGEVSFEMQLVEKFLAWVLEKYGSLERSFTCINGGRDDGVITKKKFFSYLARDPDFHGDISLLYGSIDQENKGYISQKDYSLLSPFFQDIVAKKEAAVAAAVEEPAKTAAGRQWSKARETNVSPTFNRNGSFLYEHDIATQSKVFGGTQSKMLGVGGQRGSEDNWGSQTLGWTRSQSRESVRKAMLEQAEYLRQHAQFHYPNPITLLLHRNENIEYEPKTLLLRTALKNMQMVYNRVQKVCPPTSGRAEHLYDAFTFEKIDDPAVLRHNGQYIVTGAEPLNKKRSPFAVSHLQKVFKPPIAPYPDFLEQVGKWTRRELRAVLNPDDYYSSSEKDETTETGDSGSTGDSAKGQQTEMPTSGFDPFDDDVNSPMPSARDGKVYYKLPAQQDAGQDLSATNKQLQTADTVESPMGSARSNQGKGPASGQTGGFTASSQAGTLQASGNRISDKKGNLKSDKSDGSGGRNMTIPATVTEGIAVGSMDSRVPADEAFNQTRVTMSSMGTVHDNEVLVGDTGMVPSAPGSARGEAIGTATDRKGSGYAESGYGSSDRFDSVGSPTAMTVAVKESVAVDSDDEPERINVMHIASGSSCTSMESFEPGPDGPKPFAVSGGIVRSTRDAVDACIFNALRGHLNVEEVVSGDKDLAVSGAIDEVTPLHQMEDTNQAIFGSIVNAGEHAVRHQISKDEIKASLRKGESSIYGATIPLGEVKLGDDEGPIDIYDNLLNAPQAVVSKSFSKEQVREILHADASVVGMTVPLGVNLKGEMDEEQEDQIGIYKQLISGVPKNTFSKERTREILQAEGEGDCAGQKKEGEEDQRHATEAVYKSIVTGSSLVLKTISKERSRSILQGEGGAESGAGDGGAGATKAVAPTEPAATEPAPTEPDNTTEPVPTEPAMTEAGSEVEEDEPAPAFSTKLLRNASNQGMVSEIYKTDYIPDDSEYAKTSLTAATKSNDNAGQNLFSVCGGTARADEEGGAVFEGQGVDPVAVVNSLNASLLAPVLRISSKPTTPVISADDVGPDKKTWEKMTTTFNDNLMEGLMKKIATPVESVAGDKEDGHRIDPAVGEKQDMDQTGEKQDTDQTGEIQDIDAEELEVNIKTSQKLSNAFIDKASIPQLSGREMEEPPVPDEVVDHAKALIARCAPPRSSVVKSGSKAFGSSKDVAQETAPEDVAAEDPLQAAQKAAQDALLQISLKVLSNSAGQVPSSDVVPSADEASPAGPPSGDAGGGAAPSAGPTIQIATTGDDIDPLKTCSSKERPEFLMSPTDAQEGDMLSPASKDWGNLLSPASVVSPCGKDWGDLLSVANAMGNSKELGQSDADDVGGSRALRSVGFRDKSEWNHYDNYGNKLKEERENDFEAPAHRASAITVGSNLFQSVNANRSSVRSSQSTHRSSVGSDGADSKRLGKSSATIKSGSSSSSSSSSSGPDSPKSKKEGESDWLGKSQGTEGEHSSSSSSGSRSGLQESPTQFWGSLPLGGDHSEFLVDRRGESDSSDRGPNGNEGEHERHVTSHQGSFLTEHETSKIFQTESSSILHTEPSLILHTEPSLMEPSILFQTELSMGETEFLDREGEDFRDDPRENDAFLPAEASLISFATLYESTHQAGRGFESVNSGYLESGNSAYLEGGSSGPYSGRLQVSDSGKQNPLESLPVVLDSLEDPLLDSLSYSVASTIQPENAFPREGNLSRRQENALPQEDFWETATILPDTCESLSSTIPPDYSGDHSTQMCVIEGTHKRISHMADGPSPRTSDNQLEPSPGPSKEGHSRNNHNEVRVPLSSGTGVVLPGDVVHKDEMKLKVGDSNPTGSKDRSARMGSRRPSKNFDASPRPSVGLEHPSTTPNVSSPKVLFSQDSRPAALLNMKTLDVKESFKESRTDAKDSKKSKKKTQLTEPGSNNDSADAFQVPSAFLWEGQNDGLSMLLKQADDEAKGLDLLLKEAAGDDSEIHQVERTLEGTENKNAWTKIKKKSRRHSVDTAEMPAGLKMNFGNAAAPGGVSGKKGSQTAEDAFSATASMPVGKQLSMKRRASVGTLRKDMDALPKPIQRRFSSTAAKDILAFQKKPWKIKLDAEEDLYHTGDTAAPTPAFIGEDVTESVSEKKRDMRISSDSERMSKVDSVGEKSRANRGKDSSDGGKEDAYRGKDSDASKSKDDAKSEDETKSNEDEPQLPAVGKLDMSDNTNVKGESLHLQNIVASPRPHNVPALKIDKKSADSSLKNLSRADSGTAPDSRTLAGVTPGTPPGMPPLPAADTLNEKKQADTQNEKELCANPWPSTQKKSLEQSGTSSSTNQSVAKPSTLTVTKQSTTPCKSPRGSQRADDAPRSPRGSQRADDAPRSPRGSQRADDAPRSSRDRLSQMKNEEEPCRSPRDSRSEGLSAAASATASAGATEAATDTAAAVATTLRPTAESGTPETDTSAPRSTTDFVTVAPQGSVGKAFAFQMESIECEDHDSMRGSMFGPQDASLKRGDNESGFNFPSSVSGMPDMSITIPDANINFFATHSLMIGDTEAAVRPIETAPFCANMQPRGKNSSVDQGRGSSLCNNLLSPSTQKPNIAQTVKDGGANTGPSAAGGASLAGGACAIDAAATGAQAASVSATNPSAAAEDGIAPGWLALNTTAGGLDTPAAGDKYVIPTPTADPGVEYVAGFTETNETSVASATDSFGEECLTTGSDALKQGKSDARYTAQSSFSELQAAVAQNEAALIGAKLPDGAGIEDDSSTVLNVKKEDDSASQKKNVDASDSQKTNLQDSLARKEESGGKLMVVPIMVSKTASVAKEEEAKKEEVAEKQTFPEPSKEPAGKTSKGREGEENRIDRDRRGGSQGLPGTKSPPTVPATAPSIQLSESGKGVKFAETMTSECSIPSNSVREIPLSDEDDKDPYGAPSDEETREFERVVESTWVVDHCGVKFAKELRIQGLMHISRAAQTNSTDEQMVKVAPRKTMKPEKRTDVDMTSATSNANMPASPGATKGCIRAVPKLIDDEGRDILKPRLDLSGEGVVKKPSKSKRLTLDREGPRIDTGLGAVKSPIVSARMSKMEESPIGSARLGGASTVLDEFKSPAPSPRDVIAKNKEALLAPVKSKHFEGASPRTHYQGPTMYEVTAAATIKEDSDRPQAKRKIDSGIGYRRHKLGQWVDPKKETKIGQGDRSGIYQESGAKVLAKDVSKEGENRALSAVQRQKQKEIMEMVDRLEDLQHDQTMLEDEREEKIAQVMTSLMETTMQNDVELGSGLKSKFDGYKGKLGEGAGTSKERRSKTKTDQKKRLQMTAAATTQLQSSPRAVGREPSKDRQKRDGDADEAVAASMDPTQMNSSMRAKRGFASYNEEDHSYDDGADNHDDNPDGDKGAVPAIVGARTSDGIGCDSEMDGSETATVGDKCYNPFLGANSQLEERILPANGFNISLAMLKPTQDTSFFVPEAVKQADSRNKHKRKVDPAREMHHSDKFEPNDSFESADASATRSRTTERKVLTGESIKQKATKEHVAAHGLDVSVVALRGEDQEEPGRTPLESSTGSEMPDITSSRVSEAGDKVDVLEKSLALQRELPMIDYRIEVVMMQSVFSGMSYLEDDPAHLILPNDTNEQRNKKKDALNNAIFSSLMEEIGLAFYAKDGDYIAKKDFQYLQGRPDFMITYREEGSSSSDSESEWDSDDEEFSSESFAMSRQSELSVNDGMSRTAKTEAGALLKQGLLKAGDAEVDKTVGDFWDDLGKGLDDKNKAGLEGGIAGNEEELLARAKNEAGGDKQVKSREDVWKLQHEVFDRIVSEGSMKKRCGVWNERDRGIMLQNLREINTDSFLDEEFEFGKFDTDPSTDLSAKLKVFEEQLSAHYTRAAQKLIDGVQRVFDEAAAGSKHHSDFVKWLSNIVAPDILAALKKVLSAKSLTILVSLQNRKPDWSAVIHPDMVGNLRKVCSSNEKEPVPPRPFTEPMSPEERERYEMVKRYLDLQIFNKLDYWSPQKLLLSKAMSVRVQLFLAKMTSEEKERILEDYPRVYANPEVYGEDKYIPHNRNPMSLSLLPCKSRRQFAGLKNKNDFAFGYFNYRHWLVQSLHQIEEEYSEWHQNEQKGLNSSGQQREEEDLTRSGKKKGDVKFSALDDDEGGIKKMKSMLSVSTADNREGQRKTLVAMRKSVRCLYKRMTMNIDKMAAEEVANLSNLDIDDTLITVSQSNGAMESHPFNDLFPTATKDDDFISDSDESSAPSRFEGHSSNVVPGGAFQKPRNTIEGLFEKVEVTDHVFRRGSFGQIHSSGDEEGIAGSITIDPNVDYQSMACDDVVDDDEKVDGKDDEDGSESREVTIKALTTAVHNKGNSVNETAGVQFGNMMTKKSTTMAKKSTTTGARQKSTTGEIMRNTRLVNSIATLIEASLKEPDQEYMRNLLVARYCEHNNYNITLGHGFRRYNKLPKMRGPVEHIMKAKVLSGNFSETRSKAFGVENGEAMLLKTVMGGQADHGLQEMHRKSVAPSELDVPAGSGSGNAKPKRKGWETTSSKSPKSKSKRGVGFAIAQSTAILADPADQAAEADAHTALQTPQQTAGTKKGNSLGEEKTQEKVMLAAMDSRVSIGCTLGSQTNLGSNANLGSQDSPGEFTSSEKKVNLAAFDSRMIMGSHVGSHSNLGARGAIDVIPTFDSHTDLVDIPIAMLESQTSFDDGKSVTLNNHWVGGNPGGAEVSGKPAGVDDVSVKPAGVGDFIVKPALKQTGISPTDVVSGVASVGGVSSGTLSGRKPPSATPDIKIPILRNRMPSTIWAGGEPNPVSHTLKVGSPYPSPRLNDPMVHQTSGGSVSSPRPGGALTLKPSSNPASPFSARSVASGPGTSRGSSPDADKKVDKKIKQPKIEIKDTIDHEAGETCLDATIARGVPLLYADQVLDTKQSARSVWETKKKRKPTKEQKVKIKQPGAIVERG